MTADKPATESGAAPKAPNADAADLSGLSREQLEARVRQLTDELAAANAEGGKFRQQWADLKLRDEALGVEALTADQEALEEKHVEAMKELYQTYVKHKEALALLQKLLETTDELMQEAPKYDPKLLAQYEETSRSARDYIEGHGGKAIPIASSLSDGRVADTNPDLGAVILNLGKTQGVKEGMPFGIYQDDVKVATVKIVLARDLVCAAQIEWLSPGAVLHVGDHATVLMQQ
ncbi:MAG TPA: hypothetical protein VHY09_08625 [Candidatus Methylacidiphilales bacterium]|nr:hypothetical protein [Candidatus Methylacidiphilales bacterium]